MAKSTPVLVGMGLVGLLLYQSSIATARTEVAKGDRIEVGKSLPLRLLPVVARSEDPLLSCATAFVVSPSCGVCRALAERLAAAPGAVPQPLLLSLADHATTLAFSKSTGVPRLFRFRPPRGGRMIDVPGYLDIHAVPTRLLFDARAEVVDIRLTSELPAAAEAPQGCPAPTQLD